MNHKHLPENSKVNQLLITRIQKLMDFMEQFNWEQGPTFASDTIQNHRNLSQLLHKRWAAIVNSNSSLDRIELGEKVKRWRVDRKLSPDYIVLGGIVDVAGPVTRDAILAAGYIDFVICKRPVDAIALKFDALCWFKEERSTQWARKRIINTQPPPPINKGVGPRPSKTAVTLTLPSTS